MRFKKFAWLAVVAATGCYSGGAVLEGLAPSNPDDTGPQIVWDLFAEPLPEIPFPNDIGTRPDVTAATGRRVNVSREAPTEHERTLRRLVNTLDGFGTFAPIYVRFDGRLDIVDLHRRHNNDDPTDDAIFLVNLNPQSSTYGQPVLLDLDAGRFPLLLERPDNYFPNDPRALGSNLLFETYEEPDLNGNGRFDPAEDTDDDGVQDHPNLWGTVLGDPARMDPFRDLISFYELESDTLIIRHVMPLEQASTYAVIFTRRMVGASEPSPIRSPFAAINHTAQTDVLRPLIEDGILVQSLGIGLDDIAFAWTFTTQSITKDVEALRAGLYGQGPFARLASDFPPRLSKIPPVDEESRTDNVYILKASRLMDALQDTTFMSAVGLDPDKAQPIFEGYNAYIESFVFVEFESPALIDNEDGVFLLDTYTGDIDYGRETIKMVCTIPKVRPGFEPPFPVTFYGHGYTSSRFEFLGFASSLGRFGLACCAIDAYGHGMPSSDFIIGLVQAMLNEQGLTRLADIVTAGRSRDLNDDGATDSGGDFWGANAFHTRDVVRQTMVDYFQAVRVLRNFGTETMPVDIDHDGQPEIAGDFNADGVPDIGGEQPYSMFGQSLGGILSALVGPMEPMITTIVPGSGGAGLFDLVIRSTQGGVVQAVYLPFFGPLIIGVPVGETGRYDLKFDLLDINSEVRGADGKIGLRFASVPDSINNEEEELAIGDRIRIVNQQNGEIDEITLRSTDGTTIDGFRLHIPGDVGDPVELTLYRAGQSTPYRTIKTWELPDASLEEYGFQGRQVQRHDLLTLQQLGFGHRRQTADFRRLTGFAQMVVDPADPANYAPLYAHPINTRPEGPVPTNVLVINTNGDMNVPVNTGISLARSAGILKVLQPDPRYGKTHDQLLIDTWTIEALEGLRRFENDPCYRDGREILFDIDEASEGIDPEQGPHLSSPACDGTASAPPECAKTCTKLPPLRATVTHPWGVSGMRMLYLRNRGVHGFAMPDPDLVFDYNVYQINQIGWYFASQGTELIDDVCLAGPTCPFY